MKTVSFTLNGAPARLTVDETRPLLWVLRDDLALTGTKYGCGEAVCGACTVLVDDEPVRSCAMAVGEVEGRRVTTIEGLARDGRLHPVQQAFVDRVGFQCGFCTPGMILDACALLAKRPSPTRDEIVRHMDDHLCRCGAHTRILDAIEHAATTMKGGAR
ncbi:MAG: (2Fe-2S)-binding protein [Vicinamibacteraceae bacterium]|nr:(2Fe-2S)-binding protein [Vicinamibacteraceae bacterium]